MRIDIMTLFPDTVNAVLHESIIGRAAAKGIVEINCIQIRDFTENRQNQVDDYPYGGGWGCVMMAQPLKSCLEHVMAEAGERRSRVICLSPQGKTYTQETARRLQRDYDHLVLVCGHYEGIDERFIEECVDEELSLGDFVLTGGEIAAMAVADSVCRLVPGVLADEQCYIGESHWDGLLEYPQYTRPEVWEGREVPTVLLNGNHADIVRWRRKKQLERTRDKRPEMFERFEPEDKTDAELLKELEKDAKRGKLTLPVICRKMREEDLPEILKIRDYARKTLADYNVDQWQGEYPDELEFNEDIRTGHGYVLLHGEEICAFFALSFEPEADYVSITDGKWSSDEPYAVVHRAAVAEKWRGTEISDILLRYAEQLSREGGVRYIRADTHRKNRPMQKLLRSHNFVYRGNIVINSEEGRDPNRQAFEKKLKKQG